MIEETSDELVKIAIEQNEIGKDVSMFEYIFLTDAQYYKLSLDKEEYYDNNYKRISKSGFSVYYREKEDYCFFKRDYKELVRGLIGCLFGVYIVIPLGIYPLIKQDRHSWISADNYNRAVVLRNMYVLDVAIFHTGFGDFIVESIGDKNENNNN
ncbi:MAG: hypothetical protein AABY36_00935 [Campylobacterota bacterium]